VGGSNGLSINSSAVSCSTNPETTGEQIDVLLVLLNAHVKLLVHGMIISSSLFASAPNAFLRHLRLFSSGPALLSAERRLGHSPLRVLFCGSDLFSIKSLEALNALRHERQRISGLGLVDSIHVVCRTPKRVGRGLEAIRERELPIDLASQRISLSSTVQHLSKA
jgi:hypothetical protein